jgi:hypothetical protein
MRAGAALHAPTAAPSNNRQGRPRRAALLLWVWAAKQEDNSPLATAIRRLVEMALKSKK